METPQFRRLRGRPRISGLDWSPAPIEVRLPAPLFDELRTWLQSKKVTRAAFVRAAIEEKLRRDKELSRKEEKPRSGGYRRY